MSITVTDEVPTQPRDFLLLKISGLYRENSPTESLNYRFTLCGSTAYIFNTKKIIVIKPQGDPDPLEFLHPSDNIFSGCTCVNLPIFFSRQHGLLTITSPEDDFAAAVSSTSAFLDTSMNSSVTSVAMDHLSIYHMDVSEVQHNSVDQLKAAFILHVKNQLNECYDIVSKICPPDVPIVTTLDGPLDTLVIQLGQSILDDVPAGDPRWTQIDSPYPVGSSDSMLIMQHLKDKQQAFFLYVKFLKETSIWDKLMGVVIRDIPMSTIQYLAELDEKITAAITLKSLPPHGILSTALNRTVKNFNSPNEFLSAFDLFYREITRVHECILWLAKVCEESSHSSLDLKCVAKYIQEGNRVILTVLTEVIKYRQAHANIFASNEAVRGLNVEYLPWTAACGPEGLMDALMLQHSLTANYGLNVTENKDLLSSLFDQFVLLTDFILDGRKEHVASVKEGREKSLYKQYCSDRNKLIKPLMDLKAYDRAAVLAEKYLDFDTIVRICENLNSDDRLNEYMQRFKDAGFDEFVYNWYLREGKQAKLLQRYRNIPSYLEGPDKLGKFLSFYPKIGWIQQTFDSDFAGASETLRQLGEAETEMVIRQKSMLSLAKLSKLCAPQASDTEEFIEDINKKLELIAFQEEIPDYVVQQHGYNPENPRVMSPKEMIHLLTSVEYVDSNESDFRKALDIAAEVDEESERVELILQIWRAALLRDPWEFQNSDDLIDCLQRTLFFRLAEHSLTLGYDPNNILPPIDMLIDDPAIDKFNGNLSFHAVLKAGYERFQSTQLL